MLATSYVHEKLWLQHLWLIFLWLYVTVLMANFSYDKLYSWQTMIMTSYCHDCLCLRQIILSYKVYAIDKLRKYNHVKLNTYRYDYCRQCVLMTKYNYDKLNLLQTIRLLTSYNLRQTRLGWRTRLGRDLPPARHTICRSAAVKKGRRSTWLSQPNLENY